MLAFNKNKEAITGAASEPIKREPDSEDNKDYGLESCGQDLIDAVKAGNASAAAMAIKAAFEILDSQPHEEGPHV